MHKAARHWKSLYYHVGRDAKIAKPVLALDVEELFPRTSRFWDLCYTKCMSSIFRYRKSVRWESRRPPKVCTSGSTINRHQKGRFPQKPDTSPLNGISNKSRRFQHQVKSVGIVPCGCGCAVSIAWFKVTLTSAYFTSRVVIDNASHSTMNLIQSSALELFIHLAMISVKLNMYWYDSAILECSDQLLSQRFGAAYMFSYWDLKSTTDLCMKRKTIPHYHWDCSTSWDGRPRMLAIAGVA